MADFQSRSIRNIAVVGHGSEGKTTLVESMLYISGQIDRQGRVEDGNTCSDYDAEETKRHISISATVNPAIWKDVKINLIDVPGYFDFLGEMMGPLRVVQTAAIVVGAVSGLTVGAEKAWKYATANGVGKMFVINQMDRDNADYGKVVSQLREKYGTAVCPVMLPIGEGANFKGVVNVLTGKAYEGAGKNMKEITMPADMADKFNEAREELIESCASADDELMMKYLDELTLSDEDTNTGFQIGMAHGTLVPILPCSALSGVGVANLMNVISGFLPYPERKEFKGINPKTNEEVSRSAKGEQPFSAFVFKTIADPFVGKLSMFRVCSGIITPATVLYNANQEKVDKASGLFTLRGKKQVQVAQLNAGDIGALSKLAFTSTGDTLCDQANPVLFPAIEFPKPCISKAVYAAKQGEEDKVFSGLAKLIDEDRSISIEKNAETTETLLSGLGEVHLEVIKNKLASKFGANATLQDPIIPYRETIRKSVKVQGRHKKQSGGHGQFGDVWIEFSPTADPSVEFEFEDAVVGGAVPRNFIPSVEKGLRENIVKGVLAGYPMVGLHAKLYDGSYHPVDSSEMAFKTAARIAYKKGCTDASPVLLEPIMHVDVTVPDDYMGDVMGDMNKRRGRILGMNPVDGEQRLEAEAPLSEMFKYATDLRSMTQARGSFEMRFERYEEVPANVAEKIVANAKHDDEEEE